MRVVTFVRRAVLLGVAVVSSPFTAKLQAEESAGTPLAFASKTKQGQGRGVVHGQVLDLAGKPWAGATVTLIGRAIPDYVHAGRADEVSAVTDAKGVFSARVLTFRRYSAWAYQRLADGSLRKSGVAQDVCHGGRCELRERTARQLPIRLRVKGADKVRSFGRLTHRLVAQASRNVTARVLRPGADGDAAVPPLPGTGASYELVSETGVRLFTAYVPLAGVARQNWKRVTEGQSRPHRFVADDPLVSVIQIPEPKVITVRVLSRPDSSPVANAIIGLGAQSSSGSIADIYEARPVGKTDADGEARIPMLLSWKPDGKPAWPQVSCLIHSETHGERFVRSLDVDRGEVEPTKSNPTLQGMLQPGAHTVRGRLLASEGRPAANVPILIYQRGGWISNRPYVHSTDSDGWFRIPGRPAQAAYRITALVPEAGAEFGKEVYLHSNLVGDAGVNLGEIRLDRFVTMHCHVLLPDGRPASKARIYVGERASGDRRLNTPVRVFGDLSGRATFRARPGQKLALFAAHEEGFAIESLDVAKTRQRVGLEIRIAAKTWVSGRVVDTNGKPVAGARIYPRCSGHKDKEKWRENFLRGICRTTRELYYRGAYTDPEGRFKIPFADTGASLDLTAWKRLPDGGSWSLKGESRKMVLTGEPVTDLRLVLEKRQ